VAITDTSSMSADLAKELIGGTRANKNPYSARVNSGVRDDISAKNRPEELEEV